MEAAWTGTGRAFLSAWPPALASQVESEAKILLADGIPFCARTMQDGTCFLELPCGAEIHFEAVGNGVRIFRVSDPVA